MIFFTKKIINQSNNIKFVCNKIKKEREQNINLSIWYLSFCDNYIYFKIAIFHHYFRH